MYLTIVVAVPHLVLVWLGLGWCPVAEYRYPVVQPRLPLSPQCGDVAGSGKSVDREHKRHNDCYII